MLFTERFNVIWNIIKRHILERRCVRNTHNGTQPPAEGTRGSCEVRKLNYESILSYTVHFCYKKLLPRLQQLGVSTEVIQEVHKEWRKCNCILFNYLLDYFKNLEKENATGDLARAEHEDLEESLQDMLQDIFKAYRYRGLPEVLRDVSFSSIAEDGKITAVSRVHRCIGLIICIGGNDDEFSKAQWDDPPIEELSTKMGGALEEWDNASIQSFIGDVEQRIRTYRSVCILEESKDRLVSMFLNSISEAREKLFFAENADVIARFIEEERSREWRSIVNCFGKDRDFIFTVSDCIEKYVRSTLFTSRGGNNADSITDDTMFRRMVAVWTKLENIRKNLFEDGEKDEFVISSIMGPFFTVIRSTPRNANVELHIAEHCNSLLSTSGEGIQMLQMSKRQELQKMIFLASFLPESDIFIEVYRIMLAERLLDGTSESYQMELMMMQEFFMQFPSEAFSLDSLLKDVSPWPKYQHDLAIWSRKHSKTKLIHRSISVEPKVLRSSKWPYLPDAGLKLREELKDLSGVYKGFFSTQHPSMQISVHTCVGRAVVKTSIWESDEFKTVRLSLSTGQLCVLSLFEERNWISIKIIIEELQAGNEEASSLVEDFDEPKMMVIVLLKSMMGEYPILLKQPGISQFEDEHMIGINKKLNPSEALIKLPSPRFPSNDEEELPRIPIQGTLHELHEEYIQAALMKIMKDRRVVRREELLKLVIGRLWMLEVPPSRVELSLSELGRQELVEVFGNVVKYVL